MATTQKQQNPKLIHKIKHRTHRHGPLVLAAILIGAFAFGMSNVATAAAMTSDVLTNGFSTFGAPSKKSSDSKKCTSKQWQQGSKCVSKCAKGYLQKKTKSKKQCVKTCGSYVKSGNKCVKKSSSDKKSTKSKSSGKKAGGSSCKPPLKTNSKGVCYDPKKVCPVGYVWGANHQCVNPKKPPTGTGQKQTYPGPVKPTNQF